MSKKLIERLREVDPYEDVNTGLCHDAADALEAQQKRIDELEQLNKDSCDLFTQLVGGWQAKLAASQAQIKVLREALESVVEYEHGFCTHPDDLRDIAKAALAAPTDTTALREMLAKERERCAKVADAWDHDKRIAAAIRAMEDQ